MREREFVAVCMMGTRSYHRLRSLGDGLPTFEVRCPCCGQPAPLFGELPSVEPGRA